MHRRFIRVDYAAPMARNIAAPSGACNRNHIPDVVRYAPRLESWRKLAKGVDRLGKWGAGLGDG
jgi:hypothetical protein